MIHNQIGRINACRRKGSLRQTMSKRKNLMFIYIYTVFSLLNSLTNSSFTLASHDNISPQVPLGLFSIPDCETFSSVLESKPGM